MAQNLHDLSLRLMTAVPIVRKLNHHLVSVHGPLGPLQGNKDVRSQFVVVGNHKAEGSGFLKNTHDPCNTVLQYLYYPGLLPFSLLLL